MKLRVISTIVISLVVVTGTGIIGLPIASASIEKRDDCMLNMACFVQGDYLKYYVTLNGKPFHHLNYTHEGIVDEDTILVGDWVYSVSEYPISAYDGSKFVNPIQLFFKANLKGGISNDDIFVLHIIPFDGDRWLENNWNVTEDSFIYKTLSRPVVIATYHNMKYVIDKETGITLYYQSDDPNSSRQVKVYSLVDSDIITSGNQLSTSKSDTITNVQQLQIPEWIRNNAKWWSDGNISDSDFVSGIQFMIKNNIIKIPRDETPTDNMIQKIPDWVKRNAGWWSNGLIPDNDFVQGLQYLVQHGIIVV